MRDWEEIVAIEPRLTDVERFARALGVDWTYRNYAAVKRELDGLVGWHAEAEELRTSEDWMSAIKHLIPLVCP